MAIFQYKGKTFQNHPEFVDGLAAVYVHNKGGFINKDGDFVIEPKYKHVSLFNNGLALVREYDSLKWGYIYKDGRYAINPIFDWAYDFKENRAVVQIEHNFGIIDTSGRYVLEPNYLHAYNYQDGRSVVEDNQHKCYHIDLDGNKVYKETYDEAVPYQYERAVVRIGKYQGYIDLYGRHITPLCYTYAYDWISPRYTQIQNGGIVGFMDIDGFVLYDKLYLK